ncbi:hypothetical protein ACT7DM_03905 [Bacillus cereus]
MQKLYLVLNKKEWGNLFFFILKKTLVEVMKKINVNDEVLQ